MRERVKPQVPLILEDSSLEWRERGRAKEGEREEGGKKKRREGGRGGWREEGGSLGSRWGTEKKHRTLGAEGDGH